jgi:hypothetical protein
MANQRETDMLDEIRAIWKVKASQCEDIDDGFHWWPGHHKVTVRCTSSSNAQSPDTWRLSVRTEYLKGVNLGDPESPVQAFGLGAFAPTYGWAFTPPDVSKEFKIPGDGAVYFYSATYVRAATANWLPRLFAQLSIMQAIDAQRSADSFGEMLKGTANKSGARFASGLSDVDPILYVAAEVLAPAGKEASRWTGAGEFDAIVEQLGRSDATLATRATGGVSLQTPFGADTALLSLRHDIPHPALGSGLLGTIRLPVMQSQTDSAQACMWLNHLASTSWTDAPIHGTWHPQATSQGRYCPAYGAFIPNALYSEGLATNLALWNLSLTRWARQAVWPQLTDRPMQDILAARVRA